MSAFTVFTAHQLALPSAFSVTATNQTFRVSYPLVVWPDVPVGIMTVWTNFTLSDPPKQTVVFDSQAGGDFWITWLSITTDTFLDEGNDTLDFSRIQYRDLAWNRTNASVGDGSNAARWTRAVRFDWSDAGNASLAVGKVPLPDGAVGSGLFITFKKNQRRIDPHTVARVFVDDATRSVHQRKIVAWGGYTYAFFASHCSGCNDYIWYSSSRDGLTWSQPYTLELFMQPINTDAGGFDVAQMGSLVVLAYAGAGGSPNAWVLQGTLSDGVINWRPQVGMPLVGGYTVLPAVAIGDNGIVWLAWNGVLGGSYFVRYWRSNKPFTIGSSSSDWTPKVEESADPPNCAEALRPLALGNGSMLLLDYNPCKAPARFRFKTYDPWSDSVSSWAVRNADLPTGSGVDVGTVFSAVADRRDVVHILYQGTDGNVRYANLLADPCDSILDVAAPPAYPVLELDAYDTLHAFWSGPYGQPGPTVYYSVGNFAEGLYCPVFSPSMQPFGMMALDPSWIAGAERPLATAPVLFMQADGTAYRVRFGALPSPTDLGPIRDSPWSRPGLSPYEDYFRNLDEAVSPGNLLLSVRQVDFSLPGRGLDLAVARVHAEPLIFGAAFPHAPYLYEANSFAPMGNGWQLEVPWVGKQYLHLWGSQSYRIEWALEESGLEGSLGNVFENHVGEQFRLERFLSWSPQGGWYISGYALKVPDGTIYNFWADGTPKNIVDATGNNSIVFGYTGSLLTSMTDAAGRAVSLGYSSGKLATVSIAGRTIVSYSYQGELLATVTDAGGRVTRFWYDPYAPGWLLQGIQYPTGGRSVYAYNTLYPVFFGTDLYGYPVIQRSVKDASNVTMWETSFSYLAANGRILFTNVTLPDTTYTEYNFYHTGLYSTVTRYALPRTQLGRARMWYSPQGAPSRADTYNGASGQPSYSTESLSDDWGNVVYTRDPQGHGQFLAYNGTTFGNTFSGGAELKKTTDGLLLFEDFDLAGTTVPWTIGGGSVVLDQTMFDPVPPALKLNASTSGVVARAYKSWPGSVSSGTIYTDLRLRTPYRTPFPTDSAIYEVALKDTSSQLRVRAAIREDLDGNMWLGHVDGSGNFQSCGAFVQADVWHELTIEANVTPTPAKFNLYLDGVRPSGCADRPFAVSPGNPINAIEIRVSYSGGTTYASLWVDDVKVNAGTGLQVTGLRKGQVVQLLDPSGSTVAEVVSTAVSPTVTLKAISYDHDAGVWRAFAFGADTLRAYSVSRTLEYVAPFHEFWGGSTYAYMAPVQISSLARVESGFGRYRTMWLDDSSNKPPGSYVSDGSESWTWRSWGMAAVVGSEFHASPWKVQIHDHYILDATFPSPRPGTTDFHIQYIRMPLGQSPAEIRMAYLANDSSGWEHRAFWGQDLIPDGGTGPGHRSMGAIPYNPDRWVMLITSARVTDGIDTGDRDITGILYELYGGAAVWDATAIGDWLTGAVRVSGLSVGERVDLMDPSGSVKASHRITSGDTAYLDVYVAGISAFPYKAKFRVTATDGSTVQYLSPVIEVYGGDRFAYTPPDFYPPGLQENVRNRVAGTLTYGTTAPLNAILQFDMESTLQNGQPMDVSFSGNHGTTYGSPSAAAGVVGNALRFDGTDDGIQVPDASSLDSNFELTVVLWIRPEAYVEPGTANQGIFVSKWNSWGQDPPGQFTFGFAGSNGKLAFQAGKDGSTSGYPVNGNGVVPLNAWSHVAAVFNRGTVALYLNGVVDRSATVAATILGSKEYANDDLWVGRLWNAAYEFTGRMDEVLVLGRALTADDVAILYRTQLYTGGHPAQKSFVKYDAAGRATETKAYHNGTWIVGARNTYDAYGNLNSTRDAADHVVYSSYSSFYGGAYPTKTTETVSGRSVTTTNTYDPSRGWRLSTILPNNLRIRYTYDALGRIVNESYFPPLPSSVGMYIDAETPTDDATPLLADLSGHGNAGAMGGTADAEGKFGRARAFDGTNDYVSIADAAGTLSSTSAISVSMWFRHAYTSFPLNDIKGLFFKGRNTGYSERNYAAWLTTAGAISFGFCNANYCAQFTGTRTITDNNWHHLVAVFDWTHRTFADYIDGTLDKSSSDTHGVVTTTGPLVLGEVSASSIPSRFFLGAIDEAYVVNGVLSSGEIQRLYWGSYGMYASRTVQYDDVANTATAFDENGHKTRQVFDALGRLKERDRYDAAGALYSYTNYSLDWRNLVTGFGNDNRSVYVYAYDALGRMTKVTNPGGSSRTWSYVDGALTLTTTAVDEVGRKRATETWYATGAAKAVAEWNPATQTWNVTAYAYDGLGRLLTVTDPNGGVTRHDYDDLGWLVRTTFPDGTTEVYAYDTVGNLLSKIDRAGRTTQYLYDEAGRLTRLSQYTTPSVHFDATFQYNVMGDLLLADNTTARAYYLRDVFGRVTTEYLALDSYNFSVSYGYDKVGNVLYVVYPDGMNVSYVYDGLDRATDVKIGGAEYVALTYRKDDLVASLTYYDGGTSPRYSQSYVYDDRGRPLRTYVAKGSTNYLDLRYLWNAASDVTQITDTVAGKTETYAYDGQDRLRSATGPWGANGVSLTLSYTYDAKGNWLTKTEGATTSYYVYDATTKDDRLCGADTVSGRTCTNAATRFTYDGLGQMATRTSGGTTTTYTFDMNGLMTRLVAGTSTSTYAYDALGRRVKATEAGTTTYFAYGGPNVLYTRVGSTATDYVYASGLHVLRKSGTSLRYVHADHLGNVRLVTYWQSNQVRTEYAARYKPFGEAVVLTDNANVKTRFAGEWLDASGLYYLRARYYDPTIGRFVSQNPALGHLSRPQSQNRYTYTTNNPLKYIDPSGQDEVPWWLDLLTLGLASQIPRTIDWWNRASDAERWGFIAGIVTAVAIGVGIGLSCVFAGCAGLWLLATGSGAFLGGSVGASLAYVGVTRALGGTPTQEGLSHVFYWGGWAGAAGFGIGQAAGRALGYGKPLAPEVARGEFGGGRAEPKVATGGETFTRYFDNKVSFPRGRWATPDSPVGYSWWARFKYRLSASGNQADFVEFVRLKPGATYYEGRIAWRWATQIFIEDSSEMVPMIAWPLG